MARILNIPHGGCNWEGCKECFPKCVHGISLDKKCGTCPNGTRVTK